ncbi:IS66-like element accessory protein TnpA [Methylobacterium iners]|uniref:IS66-like element accessory protein TnpA n=1 Tax=Methylobacterium iners TaxID=418707 RepID=UPI001EE1D4BC|nr:transposase [Methylobacterium iners]
MNTHVVVAGTRRSWSREEKRAIVDEAERSPSVSAVARRHGLTPSLVFPWRREFWDEERAAAGPGEPAFVPLALPAPTGPAGETRFPFVGSGVIEIELAGGHRVRADATIDPALLRGLIKMLVGR